MAKVIHSLSQKALSSHYLGSSVLVTGSNGFVASYLIPRLVRLGSVAHGIDLDEYPRFQGYTYHHCDLLASDRIMQCIEHIRPDYVFHLASQASVGSSWHHEWQTIETNIKTTYNLIKALNKIAHSVKLLLVSSGEVYI